MPPPLPKVLGNAQWSLILIFCSDVHLCKNIQLDAAKLCNGSSTNERLCNWIVFWPGSAFLKHEWKLCILFGDYERAQLSCTYQRQGTSTPRVPQYICRSIPSQWSDERLMFDLPNSHHKLNNWRSVRKFCRTQIQRQTLSTWQRHDCEVTQPNSQTINRQ